MEQRAILPDDNARRDDRFEIAIEGRYRTGTGVPKDVRILDISESGCRFYDRFGRLEPDKEISIRIGPIGPVVATVRWCVNHVVGIEFQRPRVVFGNRGEIAFHHRVAAGQIGARNRLRLSRHRQKQRQNRSGPYRA